MVKDRKDANSFYYDPQFSFNEVVDVTLKNIPKLLPRGVNGQVVDVKDVNIDPYAKGIFYFVKKYYSPYIRFMKQFAPINPRLKSKFAQIDAVDLNSAEYMMGTKAKPGPLVKMDHAVYDHLSDLIDKINHNHTSDLNQVYKDFEGEWTAIYESVLNIPVPYKDKGYKLARLKAMIHYMDTIKERVEILKRGRGDTYHQKRVYAQAKNYLSDIVEDAQTRIIGQHAVKNEKGEVLYWKDNTADYAMKLKRMMDERYVNTHVRELPVTETPLNEDNRENFTLKIIGFDKNEDGTPRDLSKITDQGIGIFASYVANLYRCGFEEDALMAIKKLQMKEGASSKEYIPTNFRKFLKESLQNDFQSIRTRAHPKGIDIDDDEHFLYFDGKLKEILQSRGHSPRAGEQRDTEAELMKDLTGTILPRRIDNFLKQFLPAPIGLDDLIGGIMYSSPGKLLATPFTADFIERPVMKFKQRVQAYMTGGYVVPIADGEPFNEDSTVEKECKTKIVRNNWFTWREKAEGVEGQEHLLAYDGWADRAPFLLSPFLRLGRDSVKLPWKATFGNKYFRRACYAVGGTAVCLTTPVGPFLATTAMAALGTQVGTGIALTGGSLLTARYGMRAYRIGKDLKAGYKAVMKGDEDGCHVDNDSSKPVYRLRDALKDKKNDYDDRVALDREEIEPEVKDDPVVKAIEKAIERQTNMLNQIFTQNGQNGAQNNGVNTQGPVPYAAEDFDVATGRLRSRALDNHNSFEYTIGA
jgi:hypothetical protein